jgi:hypothetical protein
MIHSGQRPPGGAAYPPSRKAAGQELGRADAANAQPPARLAAAGPGGIQLASTAPVNTVGYVLMSRLSGVLLDIVWDQLSIAGRERLAGQLGETIAV